MAYGRGFRRGRGRSFGRRRGGFRSRRRGRAGRGMRFMSRGGIRL